MEAIEYYTYEDYVNWEGKWELIEGQPVAMAPAPVIRHQALAGLIVTQLVLSTQECERCLVLAEEDWKIDDVTVLKPDVVLVCDEPSETHITRRPEIVVEILSPSSARRDERCKFQIYESEKVPYYLLVYPDDLKAKLYRLVEGCYDKVGDFFRERYDFEGLTCDAAIDFERVFGRFRKKRG